MNKHGSSALANFTAASQAHIMTKENEIRAEVRLPTTDLRADLGFFDKVLGDAAGYDLSC